MFEKLTHKIPLRSTFQVVGIHFLHEDEVQFCVLTIHKKQNEFSVGKRFESNKIEAIFKEIESKYPVLLHFSGVGILNKSVERVANYKQKLLFKSNPDDFYFYELHQEQTIFVSMCRKKIIDAYLEQFSVKKYHVLDIAIGPFVNYVLRPFLSNQTIISNLSSITLSQNDSIDFEVLDEVNDNTLYQIEDLMFTHKEIALFAMILQYHIQEEAIQLEAPFLQKNKTDFTYYKATKLAGITGVFMLLLGILLGHFLLNQYQTKVANEQAIVAEVKEIQENIQLLTKQKYDKEEIIATSGLFNPKFLTSYFYDIGNSVDKHTKLSSMAITPVTKKMRADTEVAFFKNQIHVEGLANNDTDFEQWIARLNEKLWVKKTEIEAYITVRRSSQKSFLIHIYF
ncbi:hypothetical protein H2O64_15325 [Kordia sp. YSTF-M3]|uniref:Uncharacterized protein n=1 Tax=Kordia aestuariivivens TaxID=2759037 RepID=A0ABR7QC09_9FLAO|nr:hypothetical protein [Kordia aestuariivivens]MBC8756048.1 hypothetical protein [Kordia aestuariivivens]